MKALLSFLMLALGVTNSFAATVQGDWGVSTTGYVSAVNISATALTVNGVDVTGGGSSMDSITSSTTAAVVANQAGGTVSFTLGGTAGAAYLHPTLGLVAAGVSTTGITSATGIFSQGPIISAPINAGSSTSINFALGNIHYTTASCGAFTLSGMSDGGTYALIVQGATSATCSFTHTGLTIRLPPSHGATTASTHTYYSFNRVGTNVYVSWLRGY